MSESTKEALARALEWDLLAFDEEVILARPRLQISKKKKARGGSVSDGDFALSPVRSELSEIIRALQEQRRKLDTLAQNLGSV